LSEESKTVRMLTLALSIVLAAPASAETQGYAGEQTRTVKSLSAQEIDDLLAGRGMGLAKAGELNHYPGPRHVLDLAPDLGLTPEQAEAVAAIFARMEAAARGLGAEIVARETAFDRRFAEGSVEPAAMLAEAEALGALYGRLRAIHLKAHLETRAVLSADQVARYDRLRGYGDEAPQGHGHGHRHG
jgi:hypothetical protein